MNQEQIKILGDYIKYGKAVVLLENIPESVYEKGAVVLDADCSNSELNGCFENLEYKQPEWINQLNESGKKHTPVLIIKDINKIDEDEQRKFIELFKYRKAYTNRLPEDCVIFATYSNLKEKPIDEELYSLMVHI